MKEIDEIEKALERAVKLKHKADKDGSRWRGMTYEDGLREALEWVLDESDEDPTLTT